MKFILLLLFFFNSAQAFLLTHKDYRLSKPEKTKVKISSEGCENVSDGELKEAIESSLELWNMAPESRLRLEYGERSGTSVTSTTVPKGEIIIGCSPLTGTSGVTNLDFANGSSRIRLNTSDFVPGGYTPDSLAGIIMHELGHAIGLHHSKDPSSVMTYEPNGWGAMPTYLSQDDVDGVTYLYPNEKKLGGLFGSCESFAGPSDPSLTGNLLSQFFTSFTTSIAIFSLVRLCRRRKTKVE